MADEDPGHQAFLRAQRCAIGARCDGLIVVHHTTRGRGMSQRSHDHEAMPLCDKHHREFHGATGHFRGWNKRERAEWQEATSARYRPKPTDPNAF